MDISKVISNIKNNQLSYDEIINCLDVPNKFVISNAIIAILKQGIEDSKAIEKLTRIASYRSKEHEFIDSITIGHLATAALLMIRDLGRESYDKLYSTYSNFDKEKMEYAIEILTDLVHNG